MQLTRSLRLLDDIFANGFHSPSDARSISLNSTLIGFKSEIHWKLFMLFMSVRIKRSKIVMERKFWAPTFKRIDQFIDLIFRNQRKLIRWFAAGSVSNVQNPTVRFNKMINKLHHAFEMLIMATALIMLTAFHCLCLCTLWIKWEWIVICCIWCLW